MAEKEGVSRNFSDGFSRHNIVDTNEAGKANRSESLIKFEVYGEEMIEKRVNVSGNSGRIYLPSEWIGKRVKLVRID